jgi:hypothetical protein
MKLVKCDLCDKPKWHEIWKWIQIWQSNRDLQECRECTADFCAFCQEERDGPENVCSDLCELEYLCHGYSACED